MQISTEDYEKVLCIIESQIHDFKLRHIDLKNNNNWKSEEDQIRREKILESFKSQQLELFKMWKKLNYVTTPNGYDRFFGNKKLDEINSWMIS